MLQNVGRRIQDKFSVRFGLLLRYFALANLFGTLHINHHTIVLYTL